VQLRHALKFAQEKVDDDEVYADYEEDESDLEDDWIATHEETLRDQAKEKVCRARDACGDAEDARRPRRSTTS
jgi:hypothetical protein